ncbi:MAG: hypothetical protein K2Y10_08550 [Burkholderiaceae bacterium]|nr:hypothetical protein [Burkholderiaceae bacterium]
MKYTTGKILGFLIAFLSIIILHNSVFARGGGGHSGGSHSGINHTGSRGGIYHYSSTGSGNKVYESHNSNYGSGYSYSGYGKHYNQNSYNGNLAHEAGHLAYKAERSNDINIKPMESTKNTTCEYKSVMTDDDYRACGSNPPPYK